MKQRGRVAVCWVLACLVALQPCSWHRACAAPQALALKKEFERYLMGMTAKQLTIWDCSHPTKSLLRRGESSKSHQRRGWHGFSPIAGGGLGVHSAPPATHCVPTASATTLGAGEQTELQDHSPKGVPAFGTSFHSL